MQRLSTKAYLAVLGLVFFSATLAGILFLHFGLAPRQVLEVDLKGKSLVPSFGSNEPTTENPRTPTPTLLPSQTTALPPAKTATATLPPTPVPDRVFELEYPQEIERGRSDWIRITLLRTQGQDWQVTVESTAHASEVATPQAMEAGQVSLEGAETAGYTACVEAVLEGQSFDIGALSPECQSLDQARITWEWNIKPKSDTSLGPQVVNIRISGIWESTTRNSTEEHTLYRDMLEITVSQPLIAYVNLSNIVSSVIGSGLSIPWLYDKLIAARKKQKSKSKGKATKPSD